MGEGDPLLSLAAASAIAGGSLGGDSTSSELLCFGDAGTTTARAAENKAKGDALLRGVRRSAAVRAAGEAAAAAILRTAPPAAVEADGSSAAAAAAPAKPEKGKLASVVLPGPAQLAAARAPPIKSPAPTSAVSAELTRLATHQKESVDSLLETLRLAHSRPGTLQRKRGMKPPEKLDTVKVIPPTKKVDPFAPMTPRTRSAVKEALAGSEALRRRRGGDADGAAAGDADRVDAAVADSTASRQGVTKLFAQLQANAETIADATWTLSGHRSGAPGVQLTALRQRLARLAAVDSPSISLGASGRRDTPMIPGFEEGKSNGPPEVAAMDSSKPSTSDGSGKGEAAAFFPPLRSPPTEAAS